MEKGSWLLMPFTWPNTAQEAETRLHSCKEAGPWWALSGESGGLVLTLALVPTSVCLQELTPFARLRYKAEYKFEAEKIMSTQDTS